MNILYDIQDYLKSLYHRIKMRVLATNAPYNAGYIRKFLCAVLNFYGEFIKLPVRDISTIPYVGYQIRNDTIFYRYCITCPEEPENMDHIRDLMDYLRDNPTNFHVTAAHAAALEKEGYRRLSESENAQSSI